MHLTVLTLALLSSLLIPRTHATSITIHNTKPWATCFKVETSIQNNNGPLGWFPAWNNACAGLPGITIPAYTTTTFQPGNNGAGSWAGALTSITNGIVGTRFEFNFNTDGQSCKYGGTWYDADMEFGISAGTVGPSDHRLRPNGLPSLAGEQDPLGKANAAWLHSPNRWQLLRYPNYVVADKGSRLVWVSNDKAAPKMVQAFFQLEAGFQAYMGAGSETGKSPETFLEKQLTTAQDQKSWCVETREMTVTIY